MQPNNPLHTASYAAPFAQTTRLLRAAGIEVHWDEVDVSPDPDSELPGLEVIDASWDEWEDASSDVPDTLGFD